ncbi:hypothetical protein PUN28_005963 [Cardiocondyla obscurior]|uniref:Secreted protein n=1 Tax=Cardiocondyla obscurior TaxID=286306 RepID=A0AAW2GCI4_9HYME
MDYRRLRYALALVLSPYQSSFPFSFPLAASPIEVRALELEFARIKMKSIAIACYYCAILSIMSRLQMGPAANDNANAALIEQRRSDFGSALRAGVCANNRLSFRFYHRLMGRRLHKISSRSRCGLRNRTRWL